MFVRHSATDQEHVQVKNLISISATFMITNTRTLTQTSAGFYILSLAQLNFRLKPETVAAAENTPSTRYSLLSEYDWFKTAMSSERQTGSRDSRVGLSLLMRFVDWNKTAEKHQSDTLKSSSCLENMWWTVPSSQSSVYSLALIISSSSIWSL